MTRLLGRTDEGRINPTPRPASAVGDAGKKMQKYDVAFFVPVYLNIGNKWGLLCGNCHGEYKEKTLKLNNKV